MTCRINRLQITEKRVLLNISGRNPVQYMICDFQDHRRGVIHDENYWCRRKQHWRTKGIDIGFKAKKFWSKLDSGTEVDLSIPASTAYATSYRRRSWLSKKFSRRGTNGKETDVKETKMKS